VVLGQNAAYCFHQESFLMRISSLLCHLPLPVNHSFQQWCFLEVTVLAQSGIKISKRCIHANSRSFVERMHQSHHVTVGPRVRHQTCLDPKIRQAKIRRPITSSLLLSVWPFRMTDDVQLQVSDLTRESGQLALTNEEDGGVVWWC
jgi:hypothetical protein